MCPSKGCPTAELGWRGSDPHASPPKGSASSWSSGASEANNTCSLRCLWKLLSESCFHLAPTGTKFNPSWEHRDEHSFCLALWWLNCTCKAGASLSRNVSGRWNEGCSQQHPSPFFFLYAMQIFWASSGRYLYLVICCSSSNQKRFRHCQACF